MSIMVLFSPVIVLFTTMRILPSGYTIAMYEAIEAERADELERIELEINSRQSADHRRVLRMRYIDGMGIKAIARRMHYSERQTKRILARAIEMIEDAGETDR